MMPEPFIWRRDRRRVIKSFLEKNTGTSGDDSIQHVLRINKQIHARPSLAMDRGQGLEAIFGVANTGSWRGREQANVTANATAKNIKGAMSNQMRQP